MLVVAVASIKGGIGKSSIVANVAGMSAASGYRVAVVDLDPQGNLGREFGYHLGDVDDDGQGLFNALHTATELELVRNVRVHGNGGHVDVAVGGAYVEDLVTVAPLWEKRGRSARHALAEALASLDGRYDLVLIDTPPGTTFLQQMALTAATHVLVPTRSDDASIDGVSRIIEQVAAVRASSNPGLVFAGCVLFGVNPAATAVARELREEVSTALGDAAPVYSTTIPYVEAVARKSRRAGVLVHEFVSDPELSGPGSAAADGLAAAYADLTVELLSFVTSTATVDVTNAPATVQLSDPGQVVSS